MTPTPDGHRMAFINDLPMGHGDMAWTIPAGTTCRVWVRDFHSTVGMVTLDQPINGIRHLQTIELHNLRSLG